MKTIKEIELMHRNDTATQEDYGYKDALKKVLGLIEFVKKNIPKGAQLDELGVLIEG